MRFASQEFFDKLKESIMDENSDDSIYTELYEVLLHDTKYRIIRNVGFEDWEDVFQEVAWSVIRQLPRYLLNSEGMHEAQRQSWLNRIVDGKSASWLKKKYRMNKQKKEEQGSQKGSKQPKNIVLSLDMLHEINEETHTPIKLAEEYDSTKSPETIMVEAEVSKKLLEKLTQLYSINTSPEKLIAFTYSRLIFPYMGDGVSGKPSKVYEHLYGFRLYDLYECMMDDLMSVIDGFIPKETFLPLREKLDIIDSDGHAIGEKSFNLQVRQITDGVHRIHKKLDADRDEETKEEQKQEQQEGGSDDDDRTPEF